MNTVANITTMNIFTNKNVETSMITLIRVRRGFEIERTTKK
jgi:hypothetical protein